jgi:hypothetical protein
MELRLVQLGLALVKLRLKEVDLNISLLYHLRDL